MKTPHAWFASTLYSGRRLSGLAVLAIGLAGLSSTGRAQLYSQDFDGGTAPGWVVASGTWNVTNGSYDETSDTAGPNIAYYGGAKYDTDYTYTASVRLFGTGGNRTGVVYYYQDLNNYYEVELNDYSPTGTVQLIEHVNSAAGTVVATGSFASSGGGTWPTVAIVRSGTTTTIQINGTTVITQTETGLTGGGYIGGVDHWAYVYLDNVVVTDTATPTVSITAPADNAQVSGATSVTASASDPYGVASVQFQLDGANLGSPVTSAPYTVSWNTTGTSNGPHALTAIVTNVGGIQSTSSSVAVTVGNGGGNLPAGWTNQDIGDPSKAGSTSYSGGTYTMSAAGTGIWHSSDQFQYAYQPITGDCTIVAKVDSVQLVGSTGFEHAGIMIRQSLDADSAYAGAYETASNGMFFEARTTAGGSSVDSGNGTDDPCPYWLELVRSGNTFTAYSSADGLAWNMLGSPITISMSSTVYVGLAGSSEVTTTATTAVFEGVSIANGLPAGWVTSDIGSVGAPGSAGYANGVYTVSGAGIGPWFTSDTFRYVYQQVSGDCSVEAKVDSVQLVGASGWEHGGVMIRESLDPSATFVGAYETANRGLLFEARTSTGGSAAGYGADTSHVTPYWVKITRSGNSFTVSSSPDGSAWTQLGSPLTVNMASTVYVGLAVASETSDGATPTAAVFEDLAVSGGGADTTPPTVSITAPADQSEVSGTVSVTADASDNVAVASVQFQLDGVNLGSAITTAPYSLSWDTTAASNGSHTLTAIATDTSNNQTTSSAVTVTVNNGSLPSGWSSQDIGSPGASGSTSYSSGTYTIQGAGTGIFHTSDEFQFAYEEVTGDCTIIAQVESVSNAGDSGYEHGGVMIRNTLNANSAYAGAYETCSRGLLFESRASAGASATGDGADTSHLTPYWVKLARTGSTFTAYSSPDGSAWTQLGTAQTISMNATVYVGLAVSSEINDTTATAVFSGVSVTGGDTTPPTVSITAPADNATVSGNAVTVSANASDNVAVASVQFQLDGANLGSAITAAPYSLSWDTTGAANGQHVLTAIATDTSDNQTTSGGIIVTVDNLPAGWTNQDVGSPGAPGSSSYNAGTYTVSGAGTGIFQASDEFQFAYQQVTGDCQVIARVQSVQYVGDGSGWEHGGIMIRETLDADSAYAGAYATSQDGLLFEARTSAGASAAGYGADPSHQAPYWIKLVRGGDTFTAYSSPDGSTWTQLGSPVTIDMAATVYVGLAVSSEIDSTPTTAVFDNVAVGTGDFTGPTVSITAPTGGAQVSGTETVSASASDNVGVAGVQFQLDGAALGSEVTTAPYTYNWDTTTTTDGAHTLTAVARDAAGNRTTSGGVSVTVNNNGGAPASNWASYQENFSGGTADGWDPISGSWSVSGGAYGDSGTGSHTSVYTDATWGTNFILRASLGSGGTGASAQMGFVYNYVDSGNYYKLLLAADGSAQLLKRIGGGSETVVQSAPAGSYVGYYTGSGNDPWVEVELDSFGGATTVRANGSRLFNAVSQTELGSGEIGLTDSGNTSSFTNLSVEPVPAVVYSEDLSDGQAQGWSPQAGTWSVSNGYYSDTASGSADYTLYTGSTWLTNYTYSVSVASSLTGSANQLGAVYNYVDANNYYEVLLNGAGTAEITKVVNGTVTSQGSGVAYVGGGANEWVTITILRGGSGTTVNVDGRRVFTDVAQGDLTTAGRIGLVASANNAAKFQDISVTNGLDPYKHTFPKIEENYIDGGSQPWDQAAYQQILARADFALLALYPGWHGGGAATALQQVKALNPTLIVGNYTNIMEQAPSGSSEQPTIVAKLNSEAGPTVTGGTPTPDDWWARNPSAQNTSEYSGTYMTNITYFVKPDAGGFRFPQWAAQWYTTNLFAPIPEFDFIYEDNFVDATPEYPIDGGFPDYNRDGIADDWSTDLGSLGNLGYRRGLATYMMKMAQYNPGYLTMGNVGAELNNGGNPLGTAEYQGLLNSALYESAAGMDWSDESQTGWYAMQQGYQQLMDGTRFPNLVAIMFKTNSDGTPLYAPKYGPAFPGGYAFTRYCIASALLENGYIDTCSDYTADGTCWFDEFNLYLGQPTEPPVRTPLSNGAFMRHFQNGLAIVNPRQNADRSNRTSAVTIDLTGQGYRHFQGVQDPTTNDGSAVTTVTVAPGDGIILVK
ncbi:MAG: Ig-like domain-containing protein [Opitutaceae bacterium]